MSLFAAEQIAINFGGIKAVANFYQGLGQL